MFILFDIVSAPAVNHYADAGEARPNTKVVIYSDIQMFICMLCYIIKHIELLKRIVIQGLVYTNNAMKGLNIYILNQKPPLSAYCVALDSVT